jgi:hypothetical protein
VGSAQIRGAVWQRFRYWLPTGHLANDRHSVPDIRGDLSSDVVGSRWLLSSVLRTRCSRRPAEALIAVPGHAL